MIAKLLALSERRVQQLARECVIPKARHGQYELVGALQGYVGYLRRLVADGVRFATAGVDIQDDHLEAEILGWGAEEESWGIRYEILHGDPAQPRVRQDLDTLLCETYATETGRTVRVLAAAIDSGGHHAESVLRFCRARWGRCVYAIKGRGGQGVPIWPRRASRTKTRHTVFMVGVDTAKDAVHARLRIETPGPGCCHLPLGAGYDAAWFAGVTAEERLTRHRHGRHYTVWHLPKGRRNQPLDCRVYATAAMKALPTSRPKKRHRGKVRARP